jgi:hypothetical protein
MQSYLQYRRISRDVESRFSKTIAHSTSKTTESPLRERSNRSPFDTNRHTHVTDSHSSGIFSTQEANNRDFEAALLEYGVNLRKRTTCEGKGLEVLEVGWAGEHDPANPKNWSKIKRISATLLVSYITFACLLPSSIDAAIIPQAAKTFRVNDVVESMVIGK